MTSARAADQQQTPLNRDTSPADAIVFKASATRLLVLSIGLVSLLLAISPLRAVAKSEALAGDAGFALQQERANKGLLDSYVELLNNEFNESRSPELREIETRILFQLSRLADIESISNGDPEKYLDAVRFTRPGRRTSTSTEPEVLDRYESVIVPATETLFANPMSVHARAMLVYVDFIHGDRLSSVSLLRQLGQLQSQNPPVLMSLAQLAAIRDSATLAEEFLSRATKLNSKFVPAAMDVCFQYEAVNLDRAIDDSTESRRRAAVRSLALLEAMPGGRDRLIRFLPRIGREH